MRRVAQLRARGGVSPALDCELTDIEAWCAYGTYFAEKLRGGVALARARSKGDAGQQRVAVAALEKALVHWNRLAELGAKFNQLPVLSNSKEPFSWASLTPAVERDPMSFWAQWRRTAPNAKTCTKCTGWHQDPKAYLAMLDDPKRDEYQKPHEVITALKLKEGEVIADIGAGSGYFTFRWPAMSGTLVVSTQWMSARR
jgi:hypothetical protein